MNANTNTRELPAEYRVLAWSGVGGQGKTALLEEFERTLKSRAASSIRSDQPLAHALVDFRNANNRAIATALRAIRAQLYDTAGLHFPTFEFACLCYLALTEPEVNLKVLRARYFTTGSQYLDFLLQALNALDVFGGTVLEKLLQT